MSLGTWMTLPVGDATMTALKHTDFLATAAGDNVIIEGLSRKRIMVASYDFNVIGAVTLTWKSGTGVDAVAISGAMPLSGRTIRNDNPRGWFVTVFPGDALNMNLSMAVAVSGTIEYYIII
jgi:hypothetical protein